MSEINSLELINKFSQENLDKHCSKEDVELLVLHALDINRNILYRENPSLDEDQLKKIAYSIERRNLGEPLAYILLGLAEKEGIRAEIVDDPDDDENDELPDNNDLSTKIKPNETNLSGGQKQIALLIKTILSNKKILILDEPTSALDDYHFEVVRRIIFDLKGKKTLLIISHDNRFQKKEFDNVYQIKNQTFIPIN